MSTTGGAVSSSSTVRGIEVQEDSRNRRELVSCFTKTLFTLLNDIKKLAPESPVDRIITAVKIGKRIDHEIVITNLGPYLIEHMGLIDERNIEKFTRADLEQKLEKYSRSDSKKYKDVAIDMFEIIHSKHKTLTPQELEQYFVHLDNLIEYYLLFCVRCKIERKE